MARHIPKPKPHQQMTVVNTKATVKPEVVAANREKIAAVEAAVREGRVTPIYLPSDVRKLPPELRLQRRRGKGKRNERAKPNGRRGR